MFAAEILLEASAVSENLETTGCRPNLGSGTPEMAGGLPALLVGTRSSLDLPAGPLRFCTCLCSQVLGVHG